MKKFICTFFTLFFIMTCSLAQGGYFTITHATAVPFGNAHDFIDDISFRGYALGYHYFLTPEISVGIDGGFNSFYQRRDYDTYTEGTVSISGIQYRYLNTLPIHLTGRYLFLPNQRLRPFVGLGLGTVYATRRVDMGLFSTRNSDWMISIKPEAGIKYLINNRFALSLSARYYHTFDTNDLNAQPFGTVNLGLVILN
jgi:opacity protein-like surface antigen